MNLNNPSSPAQSQYYIRGKDSVGVRFGNYIHLVISFLLIIREVSWVAIPITDESNYDQIGYPLIHVPEILIVILYITPGLVPRREELQQHHAVQQHTTTEYKEMATVPAELPGSNLLA